MTRRRRKRRLTNRWSGRQGLRPAAAQLPGVRPLAVTADAKCQACGSRIETEYPRLGVAVWCSECLSYTVPKVPEGGRLPASGYHLTYKDFRQLLENLQYRSQLEALLSEWFGYRVVDRGSDVLILNERQEAIDPLWLHLEVQASETKKLQLYNAAMALWR
jgi:hypothetical protein